jgi:uncharacterized membrane protein
MTKPLLAAWAAASAATLALDLAWLGLIARPLYQRHLGALMAERVFWPAAGLFYLLYGAGVVYFCAAPALREDSLPQAALKGALLGILVYGTYDLTNLAILKGWGVLISAVDVAWGIFLTALAASAAFAASRWLSR